MNQLQRLQRSSRWPPNPRLPWRRKTPRQCRKSFQSSSTEWREISRSRGSGRISGEFRTPGHIETMSHEKASKNWREIKITDPKSCHSDEIRPLGCRCLSPIGPGCHDANEDHDVNHLKHGFSFFGIPKWRQLSYHCSDFQHARNRLDVGRVPSYVRLDMRFCDRCRRGLRGNLCVTSEIVHFWR